MGMMDNLTTKSFWQKPEGKAGMVGLAGIILGGGYLLYKALPYLISLTENILYLSLLLMGLGALIYVILDPKIRNLVFYISKSVVRAITGAFIQIDPISILRTYIGELKNNLKNMSAQLAIVKGQMQRLKILIEDNQRTIENNLKLASKAKESDKQAIMILKSRKAGRLKESNMRLDDLYKKLELLYRVLLKMYENSEIMLEDIEDQVMVKEQERKAIRASHSAMKSAMNIIAGNSDKREMFDQALEAIADDVSSKIGEMERFMEMSTNFMQSIDLQNGVFEEEGMQLLEKWEKEGVSLLLGSEKDLLINKSKSDNDVIDLDKPLEKKPSHKTNQYSDLFKI
jgi:predicted  nucleic acid-binding Zn-ribbon protein